MRSVCEVTCTTHAGGVSCGDDCNLMRCPCHDARRANCLTMHTDEHSQRGRAQVISRLLTPFVGLTHKNGCSTVCCHQRPASIGSLQRIHPWGLALSQRSSRMLRAKKEQPATTCQPKSAKYRDHYATARHYAVNSVPPYAMQTRHSLCLCSGRLADPCNLHGRRRASDERPGEISRSC